MKSMFLTVWKKTQENCITDFQISTLFQLYSLVWLIGLVWFTCHGDHQW